MLRESLTVLHVLELVIFYVNEEVHDSLRLKIKIINKSEHFKYHQSCCKAVWVRNKRSLMLLLLALGNAGSHPAFLLLQRPVKTWNEFQELLSNARSPALPRERPEAAGAAAALPQWRHGAAAGQADAAVPAQGAPPGRAIAIPR